MAEKNKNVLVIGIAGALTDSLKGSIQELLKDEKGVVIIDGAEIEKEKTALIEQIESLKNSHAQEVASLNEKIETYTKELAELSAELDGAQKAAEAGYTTVKSGKKTYRVLGKKFSYKNVEYTADALVKDQKLVDELIGLGVGFLIEEKGDKK